MASNRSTRPPRRAAAPVRAFAWLAALIATAAAVQAQEVPPDQPAPDEPAPGTAGPPAEPDWPGPGAVPAEAPPGEPLAETAPPLDPEADPATEASAEPSGSALPPVPPDTSFRSAFAPLAQGPLPDLALPEDAIDLSAFLPTLEVDRVLRRLGRGVASYYGRRFHGRRTANGERFDMNALTAAHRTLPFGSLVRVTNPANGRTVTVRINDRGPFIRGRVIDLSRRAAERIGMIRRGHASVELELLAR